MDDTSEHIQAEKTKIAIVGGGPAGLVTAFELDSELYDITIYQTGFRVGGKGTSGYGTWRDHPEVRRIEEHGLHILFGFYDTVFTIMRACYEQLARPAGHPLRTFTDAFRGRDFGTVMFRFRSRWARRNVHFPTNGLEPGGAQKLPTDHTRKIVTDVAANLIGGTLWPSYHPERSAIWLRWLAKVLGWIGYALLSLVIGLFTLLPGLSMGALRFWQKRLRWWVKPLVNLSRRLTLLWLSLDYFSGLAVGLIRGGLFPNGPFTALNDRDFRDWLKEQDVADETLYSPLVSLIYHAAFSYEDGEPHKPSIAAGAALDLILRSMLSYRGHAYYQMNAGMGEVVFAPLYQVLKDRGVKFRFFHTLEALRLSDDRQRIKSMDMSVQVPLVEGREEYDPLVVVKGVETFPSEPLYEQLADRTTRQYESIYDCFPKSERLSLSAGKDFDQVVLATPIATLPHVAEELIRADATWKAAVDSGRSVQTISLQVWYNKPHSDLGLRDPEPSDPYTLLSMYWKPMSTWVTMDQTLPREIWPQGMEPSAVSYFTGTQPGPTYAPPPGPDGRAFLLEEQAKGRMLVEDYVNYFLAEDVLPGLENPLAPPSPNWSLLHAPDSVSGKQRLDYQYFQSNVEPSARVTLALPGSINKRLKADESGFENLTVAGDWIDNGVHLACMEGAFSSGRLAAAALKKKMN